MVSKILMEGGALFVGGLAAIILGFTSMYAFQTAKEMKDSATEKQITEQLPAK